MDLSKNKNHMQCLVCGETVEREKSWNHIRSKHLKPADLTHEKIFEYAKKVAHPLELRTAYVTCTNVREKIIYFSLENAELLIAFAGEHGNIPWHEIVEWQILHEKGHLQCKDLYEPPRVSAHVLVNTEDYYINKYLLPEKYWPVCKMNAQCATVIRSISPLPYTLRDEYYYTTLATFLAYSAVTLIDLDFLKPSEARFVEIISKLFSKIERLEQVPAVAQDIEVTFVRLYPPRGVSWDSWQLPNQNVQEKETL